MTKKNHSIVRINKPGDELDGSEAVVVTFSAATARALVTVLGGPHAEKTVWLEVGHISEP